MKLNQIIAIEKQTKNNTHNDLTAAHHLLQKPELLTGFARSYTPKDDEGERFAPEAKKVQVKAAEVISKTKVALTKLFDVTATKDVTNGKARADVVVDGKTLLKGVPAVYLLFLEKQLVDLATFVKKLPALDPSENWTFDPAQAVYATAPSETVKTKKIPKTLVKAEATKEHPAQVEVFHEDVVVGNWKTIKFSAALPVTEIEAMLDRVEKLAKAVKFAREEANTVDAEETKAGAAVLEYIFG